MRIRFGDCLMDSDTRELLRAGEPVHVAPRAFELLRLLLEKRPTALSKERLHEALWPGTYVSDAALTGLVKEVRAAIGDDAREPRFIRTLPAFGYAFCGDAAEGAGARGGLQTAHRLLWGGRDVPLVEGENLFGRGPESVVWIEDESVSRRHAGVRVAGAVARLEDLGSKNGTFVNDRRLESATELADGDTVRLRSIALTYRVFGRSVTTRTDGGA